jgi:acyl carrier protein
MEKEMAQVLKQPSDEGMATIIQQYISEQFLYDRPEVTLTAEFPLIRQQVIDSLQITQLISFIQERFHFEIKLTELRLENFESIQSMVALIQRQTVSY